jgi:hypothetical protein
LSLKTITAGCLSGQPTLIQVHSPPNLIIVITPNLALCDICIRVDLALAERILTHSAIVATDFWFVNTVTDSRRIVALGLPESNSILKLHVLSKGLVVLVFHATDCKEVIIVG